MDALIKDAICLQIFGAGAILGASAVYCMHKYLPKSKKQNWEAGQEERFEFGAPPKDEIRLIMAVRNDLKMQKGKVAAQCGHAAVAAYEKVLSKDPSLLAEWLKYGGTKIAVRVDSENELIDLRNRAKKLSVLTSIVQDAGHTQVAPGSKTVLAIGPAPKSLLEEITGHLKLY